MQIFKILKIHVLIVGRYPYETYLILHLLDGKFTQFFAPSGRDFFFSPNSAPLRREFRDLLRKLSRLAYGLFKHRIAF